MFSNVVAVVTSVLAHWQRQLWYLDSIGGIVISLYIALSWLATGKEQVEKLVGLSTLIPNVLEALRLKRIACRWD